MRPEDFEQEEDTFEVWPEHADAWLFFCNFCSTQWRVGMSGYTGLDYTAVLACLGCEEPEPVRRKDLFDQVRLIERGALEAMAEQREEREREAARGR
ncbi:DUF1799 domain-containing protein [Xenophilus sp. Marseille-Q4582]|uniref:DUF1799 domain-containing protein n=1 Tax=Xenophilus sp. Marseille-Q4582 TaxID=2866600 RepID=UPI001CE45A6D|nr:DUF1799 domain-containing protein [Xenophilus sp. Marseille-Q4582]